MMGGAEDCGLRIADCGMGFPRGLLAILLMFVAVFFGSHKAPAEDGEMKAAPTRESLATLVVYNIADPDSLTLAQYYAERRGIAPDHIVGLDCPKNEEITRAQYDDTIAEPLRRIFAQRGWWHAPADASLPVSDNRIRFVALMRGIPLKIASTTNYPGDSFTGTQQALDKNEAAVDSELAVLGLRTRKISGPLRNYYFNSFVPFMDAPLAPMMLVCRLDAATVATVENMIDGGIEAERAGLAGFAYVDMRGITSGPFAEGDQWLAAAAAGLRQYGMPVISDTLPALFPADYPMDHTAVYLGWYSGGVEGPMARDDFRFVPGAIAVHIHSYSAGSLRDPRGDWCAPLLAHGAAATLGNVYEPYLALTPHLDVFVDRLRNGLNFAESAYASEQVLSWMTTFVGDPLYRPFPDVIGETPGSGVKPEVEYAAFKEGSHTWYQKGRAAGERQLEASARDLKSGIVWEGLGLLQWSVPDDAAALGSFRQAEKCYGKTEDGLRAALHQVEVLKAEDKRSQARALAAKSIGEYAGFHGLTLLRAVVGLPQPDYAR
jgi:uncharacterized protein (TIGR03790 family)